MRAPSALQALVDALVALVDLVDRPDRRLALGAEAREQHRHSGADVRALHPLAAQPRRPGDDRPVWIAEDDPRAHRDELVREEQPVLEHLLEEEHRPARLGRDGQRDRRAVRRERRPRTVLDLRNVPADVVLDVELLAAAGREPFRRPPRRARPAARTSAGSRSDPAVVTPSIVTSPPVTAASPMKLDDLDVIRADRP